jgi:hypothetical protein
MTLSERLGAWFARNPIAWLLLAALLLCEWGNYNNGRDLREVCELIEHPAVFDKAVTPREKIAQICASHEPLESD